MGLKPGQKINVHISYKPEEVRTYGCRLALKLGEKMSWVYPVTLITEAEIPNREIVLQTVCGKQNRQNVELELPGLASFSEDDEFDI